MAAKDPALNILYVTNSPDSLDGEARRTFKVQGVTWIAGQPPAALASGQEVSLEVSERAWRVAGGGAGGLKGPPSCVDATSVEVGR